jgi:hypothetical protein
MPHGTIHVRTPNTMIPRERQAGVAPRRDSRVVHRSAPPARLEGYAYGPDDEGGSSFPATSDGPVGHTVKCEGVAARRGARTPAATAASSPQPCLGDPDP